MKTFEPLQDHPVVGHIETVLVRGVGGGFSQPTDRDDTIRLLVQEGSTLIGRKGYKDGQSGLAGIVETVQLVIRHTEDGVHVLDCGSENGNFLIRARSAEAFLALRAEAKLSGSWDFPEHVLVARLEHPDDVIFLGRTHAGEEPRFWPLQSGDLIDHLYTTWRVVIPKRP